MIIFDHNRGHSQGKVTKPSHHPRAKMHDICLRLFVKCNLQAQQRTGEKSVLLSNPKILQHLLPSLFPISLNACRSANHLLALHRPKHHLHVIVSQMDLCPSSTLNLASIVSTETAGEIADEIVGEIEDGTVDGTAEEIEGVIETVMVADEISETIENFMTGETTEDLTRVVNAGEATDVQTFDRIVEENLHQNFRENSRPNKQRLLLVPNHALSCQKSLPRQILSIIANQATSPLLVQGHTERFSKGFTSILNVKLL